MKYRTRIQYTETDKALMWERWRQGESLHAIARLFDRNHTSIGGILSRTGGIRPSPRRRSALALELSEREEISRGVMTGRSMRTMARAPSSARESLAADKLLVARAPAVEILDSHRRKDRGILMHDGFGE
jgi:hypothetical protein